MSPIKVAIFGYGFLGKWHAEKADQSEGVELTAIVDINRAARARAKEIHPDTLVTDDFAGTIEKIDAALIVTSTSTHYDLLKLLIENDKHIFCEKPLVSNWLQYQEIENLVEEKGYTKVLQVGHSERFHQLWKNEKDRNELNVSPRIISVSRVAPFKGRATDVDVIQDLMIHDVDLLNYQFGEEPIRIDANGFKLMTDKYDYANAQLWFPSGSRAIIEASRADVNEQRNLKVVNPSGTFYFDLLTEKRADCLDKNTFQVVDRFYKKNDHLMLEQGCFYNSIRDNKPAVVTLKDAGKVIRILEKIVESIETGKAVTP